MKTIMTNRGEIKTYAFTTYREIMFDINCMKSSSRRMESGLWSSTDKDIFVESFLSMVLKSWFVVSMSRRVPETA